MSLFNDHRVTGVVLVLAFTSFAIGGTLPVVGEKGNMGIFTLPVREHLLAVADNAIVWRWANIFMGAAAVVLLAGLSMLTTIIEGANERVFSRLGLVGWLLAAGLWVTFSAFRAVVTVRVAQETNATGTIGGVPTYYEPLAQWAFALFYISAVIGFLALAAYGGSLLLAGLLPAWVGWATLVFSVALLIHFGLTPEWNSNSPGRHLSAIGRFGAARRDCRLLLRFLRRGVLATPGGSGRLRHLWYSACACAGVDRPFPVERLTAAGSGDGGRAYEPPMILIARNKMSSAASTA